MSSVRHATQRAVGDALAAAVGQGVCFAAGLVFSIFVPRILGAASYGEWMLFRGMATFWLALLSMGDREVMFSFYIPEVERGKGDDAARIFKSLMLARMILLPVGLAGALWMLVSSTSAFRTLEAAGCLLATVAVKSIQCNLNTLIFGKRRMATLALLDGTQAILVPVCVLAAFCKGRMEWIPAAALVSDVVILGLTFALSRAWREWRPGWLPWKQMLEIARYAVAVSLAAGVITSMNNLLLYFMNVRGYSAGELGQVGLSIRCAFIILGGLFAVTSALMPSLAAVRVHHGAEHMYRWQNFLTRLGLAIQIGIAGNMLLLGPYLVAHIWGRDYADVAPLLAGCLFAVIPLWLSAQWVRQFLLQGRTRVYLESAMLYATVMCGIFFLLPRGGSRWMPVLALVGAGGAMASYMGFRAAQHGAPVRWLVRFLPAWAWLGASWMWSGSGVITLMDGIHVLAWNGILALGMLGAKAFTGTELQGLAAEIVQRLMSRRKRSPAGDAPGAR